MYAKILDTTLSRGRSAKHGIFLAQKWTRRTTYPICRKIRDAGYRLGERVLPYAYDPLRYENEWIAVDLPPGETPPLQRVIYCFWTGSNAITANRQAGLRSIVEHSKGVDVQLITPANMDEYIRPEEPLHPAFENLSLVHRSDYLRCYFMNFWGGGYCDIKTINHSWSPAFECLGDDLGKWSLGYREVASDMTATLPGRLGQDIRRHYSVIIGNGAFIMKAQTPLTREWYQRLLDRMDFYADDLARNPGNERGDNPGYPVPWIDLLGNILAPLALKYHNRLILDNSIRPSFLDYK